MKLKINRYSVVLCFFLLAALFRAEAIEGTRRHIKIVETTEARAPEIMDDTVFFSFKPPNRVRYAGIAFQHEEFRQIHLFERNEHDVLFFFYTVPEDIRRLDYRIVVDGLWMPDPKNPLRQRIKAGVILSSLDVPPRTTEIPLKSPVVRKDGNVEFNAKGPPGREIYLSGSFNGWDPYMYRLAEVRPGLYSFTLRLLPGTYSYIFRVEGRKHTDPLNPNRGSDSDGYEISVFSVLP